MAKGTPNDESMKLNFVAKVYDPVAKDYKPVYIAPDATDKVRGDVYLSDAVDSDSSAATGVVAASPKAVKTVQDNANNKLDKVTKTAQTVASEVTFTGTVTGSNGFKGNLTGNVTGNADTATKLKTARTISAKVGNDGESASATFDGSSNINITIPSVKASNIAPNSGTLPISVIPQGALDKLIHVADETARFALTTDSVQTGDTVIQDDTGVMYIVVDDSKLTSADGYQEYKAATAMKALEADKAGEADKLSTGRTITIGGSVTGSGSFDGSGDLTITTKTSHTHDYLPLSGGTMKGTIGFDDALGESQNGNLLKVSDNNYGDGVPATTALTYVYASSDGHIADGTGLCVTSSEDNVGLSFMRGYDGATADGIASITYTQDDVFKFDKPIKGTLQGLADNVQDDAITLAKLASDVGTVAVSDTEPTDDNVLIWVDTSEE